MGNNDSFTYRIHPAIGFARVGNSPDSFYLEPTSVGGLPIECNENGIPVVNDQGQEVPVTQFKVGGQVRRQAARFRIYRYENGKDPVEVNIGDGNGLKSVKWTVHLVNKKSAWWNFSELQGDIMVGQDNTYEYQSQFWKGPTLRNADVKDRQSLITDPGPRTITQADNWVELDATTAPEDYKYTNFPSQSITPYAVTTLGRARTNERGELLVLGGYGNTGGPPGQPLVSFAGGDGWFDDVSDGPVIADIETDSGETLCLNAWVVSASPKFAPELVNISTLADTFIDVGVREMGLCPELYANGAYNDNYTAFFKRDIKPIFDAMKMTRWVANVDAMVSIATPGFDLADGSEANLENRRAVFRMFRDPGQGKYAPEVAPDHQRLFADNGFPMMPMNSGDNSIRNYFIEKFMALTPTQYNLLRQWSEGKFVYDRENDWASWASPLDIATAGNAVGEPMAPGIEVTWTMRNPDVLVQGDPFRIKLEPGHKVSPDRDETIAGTGCQPGDLTKRMAVPWQADFFDCTVQDVNFTNTSTNKTVSNLNMIPLAPTFYAYWWPAQSPFNVYSGAVTTNEQMLDGNAFIGNANNGQVLGQNLPYHRGLNSFGDAVVGWKYLGFVLNRTTGPYRDMLQFFVESERSFEAFQSGYYGMMSDGSVFSTQPTTVTSTTNVNTQSQNVFPIQWLIGN
jgi:L-lysine 6-oxidase